MIYATDIAHYYLGHKFWVLLKGGTELTDVMVSATDSGEYFGFNNVDVFTWHEDVLLFKLILTHPSDMTQKEVRQYKSLCKKIRSEDGKTVWIADTPASLHYLFRNGIDAFDLIENEQAIDRKFFKENPILQPTKTTKP